jgi:cell division protein FtsL
MTKWRKLILVAAACSIPLLFFAQVLVAYQGQNQEREIRALEREQKDLIEKNKKLLAGISVLRTPERIEKIAREELGLEKIDANRVKRLEVEQQ